MSLARTSLAALLLTCLPGCILSFTPPEQHASYPASFAAAPAPRAAPAAEAVEVEIPWRTDVDDALEASEAIVIPGFFVVFQTEDAASASVAGGRTFGGGQSSGAKASMRVAVTGLGASAMQELVDAAYADLTAQLQASGRTVIDAQTMRSLPGYSGLEFVETDEHGMVTQSGSTFGAQGGVVVPASGLPVWWFNGQTIFGHMVGPVFDQDNHKAIQWVSKSHQAVALFPVLHVSFLDMDSSGHDATNFFGGGSAEVSAAQQLKVEVAYNVFDGQSLRGGAATGVAELGGGFAEFVTLAESDSGGVNTSIRGLYSAATSSSDKALRLDWPVVRERVLAAVAGLNAGFMELVEEYAP